MSNPSGGDMTGAFASALSGASSTATAEASPASTPETTTAPAESPAPAATTQAAAETPTPESVSTDAQPTAGEPPKWRWQDILANARETSAKEAAERARQEVEQQYAALKGFAGMSPEEVNGLMVWRSALSGDAQAIAQLKGNQQAMGYLRSLIGEQQAPATEPEPEADLQAPDGTLVYSAGQLKKWQQWNAQRQSQEIREQLSKEFQPLAETAQELRQRKEAEQRTAQHERWAGDLIAPLKKLPYFEEFKGEIGKALQAATDFSPNALRDVVYDTYGKLLDARSKQSEGQVLANLQQRAVAGTVNPSAAASSTPKKFTPNQQGFAEALSHFSGAGR